MKQPLSPKATAGIFVAVAAILIVAALAYFKPSMGAGPEVDPIPYKKPGSSGYGPGGGGRPGSPAGGPIGAPADAGGTPAGG